MVAFETFDETRTLGAPVVRLFRTALGRDPDPIELMAHVQRQRDGTTLEDLARYLETTDEFVRLHGPHASTDEDFLARIASHAFGNADGNARQRRLAALSAAARLGADRAVLMATLAESPDGRAFIPLLPGLAPGAAPDDPVAYRLWVEEYDSPNAEAVARVPVPAGGPCISVAMVAGETEVEAVFQTVSSLQRQTYPGWELCLTSRRLISPWPREALARLAAEACGRIRLLQEADAGTDDTAPRATLLRQALRAGTGALACLLEPGDELAPTALHEVVAAFAADPGALLLYTDEDLLRDGVRTAPRFKSAYSPDAAAAGNAIGQLAVYRVALLETLGGGPRPEAAPYELYDLAFRAAAEAGPGRVRHLPAVLCHRREPVQDWPVPPEALSRTLPGLLALDPVPGNPWPRPRFALPDPQPRVSAIVPTRDRPELLAACAAGLLERTSYSALQLLVVDNGSTGTATLELLSQLEADPRVRVLRRPGPFNFAALNNAAAAEAEGDVLLLLNDDTEVLHADWLVELVSHAVRPDVGAVGARLLYPDGTVQHAGILLGPRGAATHVGRHAASASPGYLGQLACVRDLSAVTGACMAVRREAFHAVGGMDERLAVTWNDVDLCLRLRAAGLRVLWTPHATLLHREGATRGLDADDATRTARFRQEQALVCASWGQAVEADPFLNPNLAATEDGRLVLTQPRVRRPWH
jgi:GT2 family glycosyltransferase